MVRKVESADVERFKLACVQCGVTPQQLLRAVLASGSASYDPINDAYVVRVDGSRVNRSGL